MPITGVGASDVITAGAAGTVASGTGFGASQGAGVCELVSGSTVVGQTVTGWNDTTVTFTVVTGPFVSGKIQCRVTPDAGGPLTRDVQLNGVAKRMAMQAGRVAVR